jgi:hypothetical protein
MASTTEHFDRTDRVKRGFDEGLGRRPRPPQRRRLGRFSDGLARLVRRWRRPRFSRGLERRPDARDKKIERRFSEGMERGSAQR